MAKLTDKQQKFCEEYLIDLNATQAAIRAGYSERTSSEQASRLLSNVNIQEYIAELRGKAQERTQITLDKVLNEIALIAFQDMGNLFTEDGQLKHISSLDSNVTRTLSEVTSRFEKARGSDNGEVAEIVKVKGVDKRAALDMLMKHLGGYEKDNKRTVEGTVDANVKVIDVKYS